MLVIAQEQRESNGKRPGGVTGKGFLPGRSGNPAGRPKGQSLTALLRAKLEKNDTAQSLAEMIVAKALSGDYRFCKLILDRTEGKVPDRIAGPDGVEASVQLGWEDDQRVILEVLESLKPACQLDELLARGHVSDGAGEIVSEGRAPMVVDRNPYSRIGPGDL